MRFRAIECALPSHVLTNDAVIKIALDSARADLIPADLQRLETHIREYFKIAHTQIRHQRAPGETGLSLGVKAGRAALEKAEIAPTEIDLLIYVGVARGFLEPATANVFQDGLGLRNATCFDILDACASWMRALHVAHTFIKQGVYRNIMILNSECNTLEYANIRFTCVEDIKFRFPALTIGEAATATIVSASDTDSAHNGDGAHNDDNPFYFTFRTWGAEHVLCKIPLPQYRQYSPEEHVKDFTPLEFFSLGERLLRSAFTKLIGHYRSDQILQDFKPDISFSHAASDGMTLKIAEHLKIGGVVYLTHSRYGNTVSASIPLGMALAIREGKLLPDMNVLLGCGSAGTSTGWSCFRYVV
jgi:3-oxoacyl-[acyl-carrier-protein] synthase III